MVQPHITRSVFDSAGLLGNFVEPDAYLSILLPQAAGETLGSDSNSIRTCAVAILASIVLGIHRITHAHHLVSIAVTMTSPGLLEAEAKDLQEELGRLSINVIQT